MESSRDAHLPNPGAALTSHAALLAEVGHWLGVDSVTVKLSTCTELVVLDRDAHVPDLAGSMHNHAAMLAGVERRTER